MSGLVPICIGVLAVIIICIVIMCVFDKTFKMIICDFAKKILLFLFYAAPSFVKGVVTSGISLIFLQYGFPVIVCYAAMLLTLCYFLKAILLGWKRATENGENQ